MGKHYDSDNDVRYQQHISNIAYRFGFKVEERDGTIWKIEDEVRSRVLGEGDCPPPHLWWSAWLKLSDEYGYSGIWKDRDA